MVIGLSLIVTQLYCGEPAELVYQRADVGDRAELDRHRAELGDPKQIRTAVDRLKTCRPRPLDDGAKLRLAIPTLSVRAKMDTQ